MLPSFRSTNWLKKCRRVVISSRRITNRRTNNWRKLLKVWNSNLLEPSMHPVFNRERTYVSRYLCSPVPMFPEPIFPGAYVLRYLCSPVPMFPVFCTLIVVISINRLQILPTPWYDSRLGLCLGFRFRVLVRVRARVRLELQTVFGYG